MAKTKKFRSDDELDLAAFGQTLLRQSWLIALTTGLGVCLALTLTSREANSFKASAQIMPIDDPSDRSGTSASLGPLSGLISRAGLGRDGTVSDRLVALLRSRTLSEEAINRYGLMPTLESWSSHRAPWFRKPTVTAPLSIHAAAERMLDASGIEADPLTGMVTVNVVAKDPRDATTVANAYIDELAAFLQANSFSSARQKRVFLENKVKEVNADIATLQNQLIAFQQQHKVVALEAQTQATVQSYAALSSQLTNKEMEMNLAARSLSSRDVQLIALKEEVAELTNRLKNLEGGASGALITFKDAPVLQAQYAQLQRGLTVKEKLFEMLTEQLEMAKIEEAKTALAFQVIDRAVMPDNPLPRKHTNGIVATAVGLFLGVLLALGMERRRLAPGRPRWNPLEAAGELPDGQA